MISEKYTIILPRFLVALALLLLGFWIGQMGWRVYQLVRLASQAEQLSQEGLASLEPAQAQEMIHNLNRHLAGLDSDLRLVYPLLRLGKSLPGKGALIGQVQPLIRYAGSLARAGDLSLTVLAPLWSGGDLEQSSVPAPERLFLALKDGGPQLTRAAQAMDQAAQTRQELCLEVLPERVQALILGVDQRWPLLQAGVKLLPLAAPLMGDGDPVDYLLLAQNQDELRASGGFISAIGTLRMEHGRILEFQLSDSTWVDDFSKPYPPPPEPLQRFMLAGYWVARDANWSPDFPGAARQVQSLVELSTGIHAQGVIAFDQSAVAGLLSATGPVLLPDFSEQVSAGNVIGYMQQAWSPEAGKEMAGEEWLSRKDFMGVLGKAMLEKLTRFDDPRALLDFGKAALDLIETGHLLVYLNQDQAQELLESTGLAHRLAPGDADYLQLVESNLGFNKANAMIGRAVEYQVDLSNPEEPKASLSVRFTHAGEGAAPCVHQSSYDITTYAEYSQRCYWNYWRVYLPGGSTLTEAQVKAVPGEQLLGGQPWPGAVESYPGEQGTQVLAGMLVLPVGEQEDIRLTYDLPAQVVARDENGELHYRLRYQKQPGTGVTRVQVRVRLPAGYAPEADTQGWQPGGDSTWTWSAGLDRDQEIELTFVN